MAAPRDFKSCAAAIRAAAGGVELTDDQVMQILSAIERRAKAKRARATLGSTTDALHAAARELSAGEKFAALLEKRSRLLNVARKQERFARYDAAQGHELQELQAINVGIEGPQTAAAASVDRERQAILAELFGPLVGELRQGGLLELARRRDAAFDRDVARELWRLSDPAAPASGNARAAAVAGILGKYQEAARLMQNKAGAFIRKLPGWIVRQSHDAWRLAHASGGGLRRRLFTRGGTVADFRAWRDFILPKLDRRTFTEQDIDPDAVGDVDDFLRQVYANLVSGNHSKSHGGGDWLGGFTGPRNIAKKASAERVLHFRSADDWFDYNQRFGQASLFEAVQAGLHSAARNTALMRTWGTNPEAAFNADLEQLRRRARDRGDVAAENKLGGWLTRAHFDALTGALNVPGNPTLAAWGEGLRALQSMAKLGGVVLSSIPDIAVRASALRHHGINYLEGFANGLESVLRGRRAGEQRAIADYLAAGIDGALGHLFAQFAATDGVPGRMTKLMDLFFRMNLLSWWTDSMKTGAGLILSRNLARHAAREFGQLPKRLQIALARHGIEDLDWDRIRASGLTETESGPFITGERVADAELRTKLRGYFVDAVNEAMTIGGGRETAIRTFGSKAGTPTGEAVRLLMQFKSFPLTFIVRHVQRELKRGGKVDGAGLLGLIAGTTAMGYLAMSAKDIAKGRSPRDPLALGTWFAAMQQGGGLGIYGDFLFGQYNRFGGGALETLAGPSAGTLAEVLRLFGGLREAAVRPDKEALDVLPQAARFVTGHTPFVNLFYTRLALDYLVLWHLQEAMNPGWARRFEQRIKRENNQTFFLRPSEVVQ